MYNYGINCKILLETDSSDMRLAKILIARGVLVDAKDHKDRVNYIILLLLLIIYQLSYFRHHIIMLAEAIIMG